MRAGAFVLSFAVILLVLASVLGEQENKQKRPQRERAIDRIVHIEKEIIREIPQVPRLCEIMAIEKGKIGIGDCNLYCEQEGEGVPLVLINGGPGGTHHCFHPHFSRARDFARIIYYDQRGCGLSDYKPGKEYSVEQAVDDLEYLRQALNIEKWVVLGFSYGGFLGQCYATKYPENLKGLVLVGSSMGFLDLSLASRDQEFISSQEREKLNQIKRTPGLSLAQIVYNLQLNGDWKRQSYYRPSREDIARMALYEWVHDENFRRNGPSESEVDLQGAFENCPIPTLIFEGKWDMSWSADKPHCLHRNHPNAKLVIFKESGHSIFEDEPEAFFKELRRFLDNLPEIADEDIANWKEYLTQYEKQKGQNIPEGPMTKQERAAIKEFYQIKTHIEKGQKYYDASIPLHSLLSLFSACTNQDKEAIERLFVFKNMDDKRNIDFDSRKASYNSLHIFRAPMPPKDVKEGDIWVVYTKKPESFKLDDAQIFILWKGNWMHWGNMGGPGVALQWHRITEEFRQRFIPPLKNQ